MTLSNTARGAGATLNTVVGCTTPWNYARRFMAREQQ